MGITNSLEARAMGARAYDSECLQKIRDQLNKFQHDPFYRGINKRVPLRQFAALCGLSRQTLYDLVRGERKGLHPHTRDRILRAIDLVNQGGLRWKRYIVQKAVVERIVHVPALAEWRPVMPNGQPPPPIPRRQLSPKQLAAQQRAKAKRQEKRHDHPQL